MHPSLPFEEFEDELPRMADSDFIFNEPPGKETKNAAPARAAEAPASYRKPIRYMSFGSGSSGNSCYIGSEEGGIIIDAGVRADYVAEKLKASGIPMSNVKGVLLTHDHSDHVRFVYTLLRENKHLKLFCTNRVINGIFKRHSISKRLKDYHVPIFKEIPFKLAGFEVTAFEVHHDGSDNMGFSLTADNFTFVLATDLGEISDRAHFYMKSANYLMIESNYDEDMLRLGRYPEYLKARIRDVNGHLSNVTTAAYLKSIINPELRHIFLCHLSKDNNTPDRAFVAVRRALQEAGYTVGHGEESLSDRKAQVQLTTLPRYDATRLYMLRFME